MKIIVTIDGDAEASIVKFEVVGEPFGKHQAIIASAVAGAIQCVMVTTEEYYRKHHGPKTGGN